MCCILIYSVSFLLEILIISVSANILKVLHHITECHILKARSVIIGHNLFVTINKYCSRQSWGLNTFIVFNHQAHEWL